MTKETKIGLLVGLAFIILFAIILSEKGAGPRAQVAPQFTKSDQTQRGAQRNVASLADAGKLPFPVEPIRSQAPHRAPAKSSVASAKPITDPRDDLTLPTLAPALTGTPAESASGMHASDHPGAVTDSVDPMQTDGPAEVARTSGSKQPSRGSDVTLKTETLQAKLDALTARTNTLVETVPPTDPGENETEVETAMTALDGESKVYSVQPGDTLTKIAKRTCGHFGPSVIDAIRTANSATLKNPNSLVVGQKLIIPTTAGRIVTASGSAETAPNVGLGDDAKSKSGVPFQTAPSKKRRDGVSSVASASTGGMVYQVKPRDTLTRIAKEQLGDAKRYREIVELNRGVLGKRERLRPGMKLKLPARGAAASRMAEELETSARASGEKTVAM